MTHTEKDDLVERLVDDGDDPHFQINYGAEALWLRKNWKLRVEAATRISALEEALKPLIKLKEAIDECKDDTWECQCGRSEPWWTGSNAHYASEYPDVPK